MGNPVTRFQIVSKAPDETAAFYTQLFDWKVRADNALGYRQIDTDSHQGIEGGIWPAPPQASNFVQLFVAVADLKATIETAQSLGASVLIPATVLPEGEEMAVLSDPHGMPFALWKER